jgi:hypothetical protein
MEGGGGLPIDVHRIHSGAAQQMDAVYKMGKKGKSALAGANAASAVPTMTSKLQELLEGGGSASKGKGKGKAKEEYIRLNEKELETMAAVNPNIKATKVANQKAAATDDPLRANRRALTTIQLYKKRFPEDEFIQRVKVPPVNASPEIVTSTLNSIREHLSGKNAENQIELFPYYVALAIEKLAPYSGFDLDGFSNAIMDPSAQELLDSERDELVAELAPYCNFPLWARFGKKMGELALTFHQQNRLNRMRSSPIPMNLASAAADL